MVFYIHSTMLQSRSCNSFDHLLPASTASSLEVTPKTGAAIDPARQSADIPVNRMQAVSAPKPAVTILPLALPESSAVCNTLLHLVYEMCVFSGIQIIHTDPD